MKPGRGDAAPGAAEADGDHGAAVDLDVAGQQAPVDQRCLDPQPHRAAATGPSSASVSASQITRGIAAAQRAHVPAGLEAPRPQIVDPRLARDAHGGVDVLHVVGLEPEALDPQLRVRAQLRRARRAYSPTYASAGSPNAFQYGSVPNVCRPGRFATRLQSLIPCVPPVSGSRQTVDLGALARAVRDEVADEVDHAVLAEREHLRGQLGRAARARTARGSARTGSPSAADRARSAPDGPSAARRRRSGRRRCRSRRRSSSRTNSRTRGWFGHPLGVPRPSSSTCPTSGCQAVKRLSASPPNIWHTPHGPIWTSRPASCEAATISRIVSR